jgi:phage terminase large subunit-like protein
VEGELEDAAARAERLPSSENSFRWLFLNQRIDASAPFVSRAVWAACGGPVVEDLTDRVVFAGLDLSSVADLTALVCVTPVEGVWNAVPTFWLPGASLLERARADRVPYDVWERAGFLQKTPGPTVEYEYVAQHLWDLVQTARVQKIAFDRWNFRHLKPWLLRAGFDETDLDPENKDGLFVAFGQGLASMSPALRELESAILNGKLAHGGHPVLTMCAANATVWGDKAGNRKLDKMKSHGRIDGMVALAMAMSVAGTWTETSVPFDALALIA